MKKISFSLEEKIILLILGALSVISFFADKGFQDISSTIKSSFLDAALSVFSLNAGLFIPLIIAASLYFYHRKRNDAILPLWISFAATCVIVYALKFLIERPRPNGLLITTIFSLQDYSFPSAHAALSFAMLAVIDEEFERIKIVWLIIAVLIALSRVYFGFHYFSDICFGALVGYFTGIIVVRAMKNR